MKIRSIHRFLLIISSICAWLNSHAQINMYKIEQLDSLMINSPKPLLILLSTDWCTYCAMQKKQLQKNENFNSHNDYFYFIEFDAEQKDPVNFMGKRYQYRPKGINSGIHEFALYITKSNQNVSYPSWVLFNENLQPIFQHNGVLNPNQLDELLLAIKKNYQRN